MDQPVAFTLRLATAGDIEALTDLHCACFSAKDHVPMMLGPRYVSATYRWLIKGGMSYALVAVSGDKVIGVIAVCDVPFTGPMFKGCLGEFFLGIARNPRLLAEQRLWERLLRRPEDSSGKGQFFANYPGVAQMTIGAVDGAFRGLGVFPALVLATKTYSQQRGSRAIRAGIYKPNTASRRVFVKGGWIETSELETSDTVFYVAYLDPTLPAELGIPNPF